MSVFPPITASGAGLDLSSRLAVSTAVVASPTGGTETIVGSVTIPSSIAVESGILLFGWVSYTVGTSGVTGTVKIRQTGTSGTTVATTGALTEVAANVVAKSIFGWDTAAVLPGQVYKLTLTVGSGSATSTVSAVTLAALIV